MKETQEIESREIVYWTCGMHPSVKADEKGKCPICHMDLVPVYAETDEEHIVHELHADSVLTGLTLNLRDRQLAGIETEEVVYTQLHKSIKTVGIIGYNEQRIYKVPAWISGRIDKLYVDYTGLKIRRGDPLALVYSPQLFAAQEEYLQSLTTLDNYVDSEHSITRQNAELVVESTKKRLQLWGMSEDEFERLEREREAKEHITITSTVSGTVVEKMAQEGQYVKEGQVLFNVADLSQLWVLADVYEFDLGWVREGQRVTISAESYPGEEFIGTVSFIDPVLHSQTRSVKIRVEVENENRKLKPGMFVDVALEVHLTTEMFSGMSMAFDSAGAILAVPATAVLHTGVRKIVYEEIEEGKYQAREIKIGPRAGDYYPVFSGLTEGTKVVVKGNFLLDSQTKLTGLESAVYDAALDEKSPSQQQQLHKH